MSENDETKFEFGLEETEELPDKEYVKGSKYDQIIESYIDMETTKPVKLTGLSSKASYLKQKINDRIKKLELEDEIEVKVINNQVYLVKTGGE